MFGWFKRKRKPVRLMPEALWVVSIESDLIQVTDDKGAVKSITKAELSGIVIETNDSGPAGCDVWWLLFGEEEKIACFYPQGATGENAALDYFMALPSFNHDEMIQAMGSTSNAVFPVWRKRSPARPQPQRE
ncbi:hypothetical protein [Nitrospirillum iridis]|uniref:Uncharacterized protein n=1 Tax=Nitrospirillum iridis TaxID=765888 RepID=A0A7X0EEN7_9PROT|nr:hypothetical protein [Nitrospirillum iridis]MBB6254068.1 hypothetical protein [Nitrospirillum iridis]